MCCNVNFLKNIGEIKDASGIGTVSKFTCGYIIRIYVKVKDEIIRDCKFKPFGCSESLEYIDIIIELIKNKKIELFFNIIDEYILNNFKKINEAKECCILAKEAINAALWDYSKKNNIKIKGLKKLKKYV